MLTDRAIRAAKPREKDYRLSDGRGLSATRLPQGPQGRANSATGTTTGNSTPSTSATTVPGEGEHSLADMRREAQRLRDIVRAGLDPRETHQPRRRPPSRSRPPWPKSWYRLAIVGKYRRPEDVRALLDRHILPSFGLRLCSRTCAAAMLFLLVAGIADGSGNDGGATPRALRVRYWGYSSGSISYGVSAGLHRGESDSKASGPRDVGIVRGVALAQSIVHRARDVRRAGYGPTNASRRRWSVRCSKSSCSRAARTGEALGAKWEHIDLETDVWHIPPGDAERHAKSNRPHLIHLSKQAKAVFASLPRYALPMQTATTRESPWLFVSPLDPAQPIDEKAASRVIRRAFDTDKRKPSKDWQPVTKGRGSRSNYRLWRRSATTRSFVVHDLRRTFRSRLADLGYRAAHRREMP